MQAGLSVLRGLCVPTIMWHSDVTLGVCVIYAGYICMCLYVWVTYVWNLIGCILSVVGEG